MAAGTASPGQAPAPVFSRKLIAFCLAGAVFGLLLENMPALDRAVQDLFFRQGRWLITSEFHNSHKFLLYTLPKCLIGAAGGLGLLVFLASFTRQYGGRLAKWRRPALLAALSIALVPLAVAGLKAVSGVYGPVDLAPYGGRFPHTGLLEQLWLYGMPAGGRSFPAGHASGGFALFALAGLPVAGRLRLALAVAAFGAGWGMGLYQMARGEHFLSHTLTTMFLALALVGLINCLVGHLFGRPLRAGPQ